MFPGAAQQSITLLPGGGASKYAGRQDAYTEQEVMIIASLLSLIQAQICVGTHTKYMYVPCPAKLCESYDRVDGWLGWLMNETQERQTGDGQY